MSAKDKQQQRLSRLPLRTSESKQMLQRGKSFDKMPIANTKKSLDKNNTRSKSFVTESGLVRQRSGSIVRQRSGSIVRQPSGSIARQTFATPLNQIGRFTKSPLLSTTQKDSRPVNDRKWQYDQLVVVRKFVAAELSQFDYNNIKAGMSLDMFIVLINSLFQMIDRRFKITRENYIEEVPSCLRTCRYMVNVKGSLMKTVNAPHSWPHVIAIFSWLVDLIKELNTPAEPEDFLINLVDKTICKMYKQWSRNSDAEEEIDPFIEFKMKLEEIYDVNDEKLNKVDKEILDLKEDIKVYHERNIDLEEKCKNNQIYITETKEICEKYLIEEENLEKSLNEEEENLRRNMSKIDGELTDLSAIKQEQKATIEAQPYNFNDKQQLKKELDHLKNTTNLKKEQLEKQRRQLELSDFQLTDFKQQMETKACKYNGIINQLELQDSKFEKLHIRENSFLRSDTLLKLQNNDDLVITYIAKMKKNNQTIKTRVNELDQKVKKRNEKLTLIMKELEEFDKNDAEVDFVYKLKLSKMAWEVERRNVEVKELSNAIQEQKKLRVDLQLLQETVKDLNKGIIKGTSEQQEMEYEALQFFLKLDQDIKKTLNSYRETMQNVSDEVDKYVTKSMETMVFCHEESQKTREETENLGSSNDVK